MGQLRLLRVRRFAPFFWAQLFGALNDNVLRNALVVLFAFRAREGALAPDTLVNLSTALFMLPFFLLSATAGRIADAMDKARLVRIVKAIEVGLMALAATGLVAASVPLLLGVLFLTGAHSALFGPVKYSILPAHLAEDELVGGNALVQTATFAAILAGTIVGGLLAGVPASGPGLVGAALLALAVLGWLASLGVPPAPTADPRARGGWNVVRDTARAIAFARADRAIWVALLALAWFWFYGAVVVAQLPGLTRDVLGGDERTVTLVLAIFSVGVGAGCLLCERMSGGRIELGLVPLGALGLSVFGADVFFASAERWRVFADVALVGASGGFYVVPLQAFVQSRSEPAHRSRVIAAGNILSAAFMVGAAGFAIGLRAAGLGIPALFLATAVANAAVGVVVCALLPELPARLVAWLRGRGFQAP
jgi:MFS family permease